MSFGFSFWTGNNDASLLQLISADSSPGCPITTARIGYKDNTLISFAGTDFSRYYVTYLWDGTLRSWDDYGTISNPSPRWPLRPPVITFDYGNKTVKLYWDYYPAGVLNPYNAQFEVYYNCTVWGA